MWDPLKGPTSYSCLLYCRVLVSCHSLGCPRNSDCMFSLCHVGFFWIVQCPPPVQRQAVRLTGVPILPLVCGYVCALQWTGMAPRESHCLRDKLQAPGNPAQGKWLEDG